MQAAGIDRRTAVAYERLLSNLYVLDIVPARFTSRLKRLGQLPKRYLIDPALAPTGSGADVTPARTWAESKIIRPTESDSTPKREASPGSWARQLTRHRPAKALSLAYSPIHACH